MPGTRMDRQMMNKQIETQHSFYLISILHAHHHFVTKFLVSCRYHKILVVIILVIRYCFPGFTFTLVWHYSIFGQSELSITFSLPKNSSKLERCMNQSPSDSLLDVGSQIFYRAMEIANLLLEKWQQALMK